MLKRLLFWWLGDPEAHYKQFDAMGYDKVKLYLDKHLTENTLRNQTKRMCAINWIARYERAIRLKEWEAGTEALATAKSAAEAAWVSAEAAKTANEASRTANLISTFSVILSVIALGVAIISIFVGGKAE